MRKIILSTCLCLIAVFTSAVKLTSTTGKPYTTFPGIGYVFIFNGLTDASKVTYDSIPTNVKWYRFSDTTTPVYTGVDSFDQLENNKGYILEEANGNRITFWVIDYKLYKPVSIEPENNPTGQCQNVTLNLSIPTISYTTLAGSSQVIPRDFIISYKTLSNWTESKGWEKRDTTYNIIAPAVQRSVPAPYCDTKFLLIGDQFATALGINKDTVSSTDYVTSAVISHLTTNVNSRQHDKNNEGSAPSGLQPINFSAPIDVHFLSNANVPTAQFYKWGIYKDNVLIINRTDVDHRYTFNETGTYKVKLTVSNSTCSFTDSLTIVVTESAIYVPNVFTPNGDNVNDEFRIGYKSLISFQCWVYNRWGRQVYYWTDPTKGWDGNINGKKAVPGPYFYVIKAVGSDKKVYKMKGDINLLRGTGNQ
ncbi:MAG: gliding motility-associated C-terminal domain-containing protein [Paludibacter sp.]|nr:gliding motility-associated C-terminal domain-containing protein [Paludibacter sp.]